MICAVLVLFLLLSCAYATVLPTAAEERVVYETVLLIDVSWSMNSSDEERLALEAASSFAHFYPTYADLYISLVIYSTEAETVLERVNVCTEEGMRQYQACLGRIRDGSISEQATTVPVFEGLTNTGAAMQLAQGILDRSDADKKATLLFTDGNVDLDNPRDEQASEAAVVAVSDHFKQTGVPVYCVGLNADGTVDESFLKSVSDKTGGETRVCTDKSQLDSLFAKVFSLFMSGSYFDEDKVTEYQTTPDVVTEHTVNIYGQAIKELNVSLVCSSEIKRFYVQSADGTELVNVDLSAGEEPVNTDKCIINRNANGKVVNIKLVDPADGNWTVGMLSQTAGTVKVSEIYTYNLYVHCELPADLNHRDKVELTARVYNRETGEPIANERMYKDSTLTVTATNTQTGKSETFRGKYEKDIGAYSFKLALGEPGEYTLTYAVTNEQFVAQSEAMLSVAQGPAPVGTIITICAIIAGVVIVLAVLAFLYVKKRMLIRINFRVKLVCVDENGNNREAIYAVNKFAGKKNVRGKMLLSEVLNSKLLAHYSHGDIEDDDERMTLVNRVGKKLSLVGMPFQNGFRILTDDGKKYSFTKTQTNVPVKVDGETYRVCFGNTTAFRNTDS